jgi:hypothetical protein
VSFVTALTLLTATTSHADSRCEEALQAGIEAVNACEKTQQAYKALIVEDQETISLLIKQRNEAIASSSPSAHLPFYFWLVLGAASGIVLVRGFK